MLRKLASIIALVPRFGPPTACILETIASAIDFKIAELEILEHCLENAVHIEKHELAPPSTEPVSVTAAKERENKPAMAIEKPQQNRSLPNTK